MVYEGGSEKNSLKFPEKTDLGESFFRVEGLLKGGILVEFSSLIFIKN